MATDDDSEALTDTLQRIAVIATPIVRTLAQGARWLPRVPWVLVASTTASLVVTLRAGVREVRVLGSLVAHSLELATGRPADPALVKQLTLELYLSPRRTPTLDGGLPLGSSSALALPRRDRQGHAPRPPTRRSTRPSASTSRPSSPAGAAAVSAGAPRLRG